MHRLILANMKNIRINYDFVILVIILLISNVIYWAPEFHPIHDTEYIFDNYYRIYNHFYFEGTVPLWNTFSQYGRDDVFNYLFFVMSPFGSFMMTVGKLLDIQNVLLLFKLSIFAELGTLLIGTYLLTKQLFCHRLSVFFVCVSVILSATWFTQLWFGLRIYYLFPLIVLLLIKFYTEEKAHWLWLSGFVGIAWANGSVYFIALWIPICIGILLIFLVNKPHLIFSLFERNRKNLFSLTLLIFITLAYSHAIFSSYSSIHITRRGDNNSGLVSLEEFLTFADPGDREPVISTLITGFEPAFSGEPQVLGIYVGLFPLLMFIIIMFRGTIEVTKKPFFWALVWSLFFLVSLYLSGFFARIYFYFPTLPYYRHLTFTVGFIQFIMLLISGFGFEIFLNNKIKFKTYFFAIIAIILIADYAYVTHNLINTLSNTTNGESLIDLLATHRPSQIWSVYFLLRLVFYIGATVIGTIVMKINLPCNKKLYFRNVLIIIAVVIDLTLYQIILLDLYPQAPPDLATTHLTNVNRVTYQVQRQSQPTQNRQQVLSEIAFATNSGTSEGLYSIMQYETCETPLTIHLISSEFLPFQESISELDDSQRQQLLGCSLPKLRIVPNAQLVRRQATGIIRVLLAGYDVEKNVIIQSIDTSPQANNSPQEDVEINYQIDVTEYSEGHLVADITSEQAGWLIYADVYHDGWTAKINNQPVPIYEAYGFFKTIWLPAGTNHIMFKYVPATRITFNIIFLFHNVFAIVLIATGFYSGFIRQD